jgi:hypothetical protein
MAHHLALDHACRTLGASGQEDPRWPEKLASEEWLGSACQAKRASHLRLASTSKKSASLNVSLVNVLPVKDLPPSFHFTPTWLP